MHGYGYGMDEGQGWALGAGLLVALALLSLLVVRSFWVFGRGPASARDSAAPGTGRVNLDERLTCGGLGSMEYCERLDALHESR